MVGLFSKFSVTRASHRRTQSAVVEREDVPPNTVTGAANTASPTIATHGVDVALEFKPVEHPIEPLDNDQPVQCPLPEPSILNDGRIWKERASAAGVRRRADLPPLIKGGNNGGDSEGGGSGKLKTRPPSNRMIMPSMSAPEHDILNMLDECNASRT